MIVYTLQLEGQQENTGSSAELIEALAPEIEAGAPGDVFRILVREVDDDVWAAAMRCGREFDGW